MRKIFYFAFTFLLVSSIFCLFNLNTEEPKYLKEFCPVLAIISWFFYFYLYKGFFLWERVDDSSEYPPVWVFNEFMLIFYLTIIGVVAMAFINRWIGLEFHWYSWILFFLISGSVSFLYSAFLDAKEDPNDEGSMAQ